MRVEYRNIAVWIILSIVTCGIVSLVWMALINNDTNYLTSARRSSGGVVVLLSIITCGIYGIYWNYTNAKLLYDYQVQNGAQYATDQSIITLILSLFGLGLVSSAIMQDTLNKIIEQQ